MRAWHAKWALLAQSRTTTLASMVRTEVLRNSTDLYVSAHHLFSDSGLSAKRPKMSSNAEGERSAVAVVRVIIFASSSVLVHVFGLLLVCIRVSEAMVLHRACHEALETNSNRLARRWMYDDDQLTIRLVIIYIPISKVRTKD